MISHFLVTPPHSHISSALYPLPFASIRVLLHLPSLSCSQPTLACWCYPVVSSPTPPHTHPEARSHLVCTTAEVCQITLTAQSTIFQEKIGQGSELTEWTVSWVDSP